MSATPPALRVGIVCPYSFSHPGGVQNHVLGLAGWLAGQGHQVQVLAPGRAPDAQLAAAGLPRSRVQSAGRAVPVPYNGSVARVSFGPLSAWRVRGWLQRGQFDVVHLHEPMTPSISLLALAQAQAPVVATMHTATPGSRTMHLAYRVMPWAARRIGQAVAVSEQAAAVARRHGGIDARVVANGIRLEAHRLGRCTGRWRGPTGPRITFIGRHGEPRKGFELLLAALGPVRAVHPDLDVVVIGAGPSRALPGVRFLGAVDDATRDEVLRGTDAYVAPQTGRESFGIVLLEALACGAPVVAADLPAFSQVLRDEHGPVGELFRSGSADDLSRALLASLARPRDEQLERGRARAARFDWQVVAPELVQVYRQAMVGTQPRESPSLEP